MSNIETMRAHARSIRMRLMMPTNAVPDHGIHLRHAIELPKLPEKIYRSPTDGLRKREKQIFRAAQITAAFYGVDINEIVGLTHNKRELARVRHIACYIAHRAMRRSFSEIGRALQYRDHTTALHGVRKIEERLRSDQLLSIEVQTIINQLPTEYRSER